MVITKREDVTKQGFCKILWRKLRLRGSLLLVLIQFQSHCHSSGWGGSGRLFEFDWEGRGWGWVLIRGWARASRWFPCFAQYITYCAAFVRDNDNFSLSKKLLFLELFSLPIIPGKVVSAKRGRLASMGGQETVSWLQTVAVCYSANNCQKLVKLIWWWQLRLIKVIGHYHQPIPRREQLPY